MKDTVIDQYLKETSSETKINLTKSLMSLSQPLESHDIIKSFLQSIKTITDYLKTNENNLNKYHEPIKSPIKEQKKKLFVKKSNHKEIIDSVQLINDHLVIIQDFKLVINTTNSR